MTDKKQTKTSTDKKLEMIDDKLDLLFAYLLGKGGVKVNGAVMKAWGRPRTEVKQIMKDLKEGK